jgi:hypothetical protein
MKTTALLPTKGKEFLADKNQRIILGLKAVGILIVILGRKRKIQRNSPLLGIISLELLPQQNREMGVQKKRISRLLWLVLCSQLR